MKSKKVTQKDVLFFSISFFIVVLAWIGFNIYHIFVTSTISEELQVQIAPINGNFDTSTLDALETRTKVVPLFSELPVDEEASPAATIRPEPTIAIQQEVTIEETQPIASESVVIENEL